MVNLLDQQLKGRKRLVIVGGGFAGLKLAESLHRDDVQIVLFDKANYHTFQPLLYQVATAAIDTDTIVRPFRDELNKQDNLFFRMAEVLHVDTERQWIDTSIGHINYDYLVVATGAQTNFYGNKVLEEHAFQLKSLEDALQLRNKILKNFEEALLEEDEEHMNSLIDYVIVGGGPTGVEVAGALAELKNYIFKDDYRELDILKEMDIHLVQSGDRLLPGMSEQAGRKAERYLEDMGVDVIKNTRVSEYDGYYVKLSDGQTLITKTLIWGAGVCGNLLEGLPDEAVLRGNRYKVDAYNQIEGLEHVFAIGDIAAMVDEEKPRGHPMMAQPAIQMGKHLAKNLNRLLDGKAMQPFRYKDKGSMATVGKNKAVVDTKSFKMGGFMAWMLWGYVHCFGMKGAKNRLNLILHWLYGYVSTEKGHRIIMADEQKNEGWEPLTEKAPEVRSD